MKPTPEDLQALEEAARESLADSYGHPLTDEEWAEAKAHLLLLTRTLRDTLRDQKREPGDDNDHG
jgi:hypothetical protein